MSSMYSYHSLEDFLTATMLTVDGQVDDGWGRRFPVKGREIRGTVLFADITGFSGRTAKLDPTETLAFVNHFFAWISGEALQNRPGIVDKYIGDEVMVVFSTEFGSEDPFLDAVQTARWMGEKDAFAFEPHIGLASGKMIVGYVGTPLKYNCSVFGAPVALAARCAGIRPEPPHYDGNYSSLITFPAADWGERDLNEVFPNKLYEGQDGIVREQQHAWKLLSARPVEMKNLSTTEVRQIVHTGLWFSDQSPEDRAREAVRGIGRRWVNPEA